MHRLTWKLLIPLVLLSLLSFVIAHLLNSSLDYSSVFLNLATDLIMVIITIYYVDKILKSHETERWFGADFSINAKIVHEAFVVIEKICVSLGAYNNTWLQEFGQKIYNPRGTPQTGLFLYFIRTISDETVPEIEERFAVLTNAQQLTILQAIKELPSKLQSIVDSYSIRLTPEVLEKILEIQNWI